MISSSKVLLRRLQPRVCRAGRCISTSTNLAWRYGYLVKRRVDHFQMGGKIGIETLMDIEKHMLAEMVAHSILKFASSETLRQNADLRMDWQTTIELVLLHYVIYQERLAQYDLDGELFMQEIMLRVYMNMNMRRKDFEKALQVGMPEKRTMGPLSNTAAMLQRSVTYLKGINGTDMDLAEALWTYLANREEFEIDDDEYEKEHGSKKNQLIIDRYFNPEGIEYLVHYVRKNIKLLDEKSFLDYKLCSNFVDTDHDVILQHQRHFREYVFGFVLPEQDPLKSNRAELERCLEFDYGQKQNMSWFQRIGVVDYKATSKLELELKNELINITDQKLEQFMENKDRLNLFDQTQSEYKRKTRLPMENRDLSCLFSEMLQNWKLVETPNIDIAHSISLCVEIASRVQSLSLFSSNEDVEEITTSSLRYLMVKYFEAQFRLKPHERDPQMDSLREVMGLNDYGLKHNEAGGRQDPRTAKIERYKKEKRLKEQVSKFEKDYPEGSAEEELERKYWFDFIELAETNSSEHISMLKREVDMIKLRERGVRPEPPRQPPNGQHSQPIIVTRDAQMKQVFGLGYPSRPVYTVEEFGDVMVEKMKQEAIDKAKWEAENPKPASMDFRELTEEEEEKERRNAQRWDNHKDYTRRGDGNRKNMG